MDLYEVFRWILCYIGENGVAFASLLVSMLALGITWVKNIKDRNRADDKELFEHLKFSLEQAYSSIIFAESGQPKQDRIGWLAGARHIVRFWELRKGLKTKLYTTICAEQEEYWSQKIYEILTEIKDSNFFSWINPSEMEEETIEPRSVAIVYAFSKWKEGMPDPIEAWPLEKTVSEYKLFSAQHRQFRAFIEAKFPKLAVKVKKGSK